MTNSTKSASDKTKITEKAICCIKFLFTRLDNNVVASAFPCERVCVPVTQTVRMREFVDICLSYSFLLTTLKFFKTETNIPEAHLIR